MDFMSYTFTCLPAIDNNNKTVHSTLTSQYQYLRLSLIQLQLQGFSTPPDVFIPNIFYQDSRLEETS
jgi:hypothetical protein